MSIKLQLQNFRLTTAEILYRMPDYYHLLQTYIWQEIDLPPDFPELHKFLSFWECELDGRLHSVRVASAVIIQPSHWENVVFERTLH